MEEAVLWLGGTLSAKVHEDETAVMPSAVDDCTDESNKQQGENEMPAPKKNPTTGVFRQMCFSSNQIGETNDCAVKAVAIAAAVPYGDAWATLNTLGRVRRQGTYIFHTQQAMKLLGYKMEEVDPASFINKYPKPHCNVLKGVTTHHMDRFNKVWADGNTYMVRIEGHILTVVNGVSHDWTRGRAKRVTNIWKIVKA